MLGGIDLRSRSVDRQRPLEVLDRVVRPPQRVEREPEIDLGRPETDVASRATLILEDRRGAVTNQARERLEKVLNALKRGRRGSS